MCNTMYVSRKGAGKRELKRNGLSVKKVAERAGIPVQSLCRWFSGSIDMREEQLQKVANILGCELKEIARPNPLKGGRDGALGI